VNRFWNELSVSYAIASEFIRDDLHGSPLCLRNNRLKKRFAAFPSRHFCRNTSTTHHPNKPLSNSNNSSHGS
jgi:hypothetical protein